MICVRAEFLIVRRSRSSESRARKTARDSKEPRKVATNVEVCATQTLMAAAAPFVLFQGKRRGDTNCRLKQERERERGENMGPFRRFDSAQPFLLSSAGRRREEAAYRGSARVKGDYAHLRSFGDFCMEGSGGGSSSLTQGHETVPARVLFVERFSFGMMFFQSYYAYEERCL